MLTGMTKHQAVLELSCPECRDFIDFGHGEPCEGDCVLSGSSSFRCTGCDQPIFVVGSLNDAPKVIVCGNCGQLNSNGDSKIDKNGIKLETGNEYRVTADIAMNDDGWFVTKFRLPDDCTCPVVRKGSVLQLIYVFWTTGPAEDENPGFNFSINGDRKNCPELLQSDFKKLYNGGILRRMHMPGE